MTLERCNSDSDERSESLLWVCISFSARRFAPAPSHFKVVEHLQLLLPLLDDSMDVPAVARYVKLGDEAEENGHEPERERQVKYGQNLPCKRLRVR